MLAVNCSIPEGIGIIINDLVPKTNIKVWPKWPFTTFEDKDTGWLTALGFIQTKAVESYYWIKSPDTGKLSLLMTRRGLEELKLNALVVDIEDDEDETEV